MKIIDKTKILVIFAIVLTLILTGCESTLENVSNTNPKGKMEVHFIDVGQGDSSFVQLPNNETVLIDGGTRSSGKKVVDYLKKLGVKKIDYLIATHPHEDHIGGLPEVIRNFEVGRIFMPNKTANTVIFEELLLEIKKKDLKIELVNGGDVLIDDDELKFEIFAPNSEKYEKTNDYSIVNKITYINNAFLFTGDAEVSSEKEMIKEGYDLSSDVLKVGHHGSSTSTTEEFLKKVDPKIGVISSGKGNNYGHPHKETIKKLKTYDVKILRTDKLGDIRIISDGNSINVIEKEKKYEEQEGYFIGNKNTKVYHSHNCNALPKEKNQVIFNTKEEAEKNGYRPHNKCIGSD